MDWAISSQASQGWEEGSTTRKIKLEQPKFPRALDAISDDVVWAAMKVAEVRIKSLTITKPMIFDVSPTDTPMLTMAKRKKADARYHQWQEDKLEAATSNKAEEGADATYGTAAQTTTLGNYCQISTKTVDISRTLDIVKKYGRKSEVAFQLMKRGKALKRDMEFTICRNQESTNATARATAGWETMIDSTSGNLVRANSAQTADYSVRGFSSASWTAPEDGSTVTFIEADLVSALGLAWEDGGDPSIIMMSKKNKNLFNSFAGVATKYNEVKGTNQAVVTGASDMYVSSYGNHMVKLNRYMRDTAVFCIDPGYISVAYLDGIKKEKMAKTGDSERYLMTVEYALVVDNRDAHATVGGVGV